MREQQPWAAIETAADHEDNEAEQEQQRMLISTMAARQLMLMRIHKDDPRSNGDIAGDVLQFVQMRNKSARKHNLSWYTALYQEQVKTIWNLDLKELHEEPQAESGRACKQQRQHTGFRVSVARAFLAH